MNDVLKQRLVGALILLALGVVFWPIIFVEPGERYAQEYESIPAAPELDSRPIEAPTADGLRGSDTWVIADEGDVELIEQTGEANSEVIAEQEDPQEALNDSRSARTTRTEAPQQPALDDMGLPIAWILQVATVSSAAKADALRNELLAQQEKAYVKKLQRDGKALYRVYVGPNIERAQLEKIQPGVNKQFGVKSMIVRYVP